MPFSRPTATELQAQVDSDIAGALGGDTQLLPVANMRVIGKVQAEGFGGANAYLDWISKQAVPFTATGEAFLAWAALIGEQQKVATAATGTVTLAGTVGKPLGVGAPVTIAGINYVTTADATVDGGGTLTAPLVAVTAGASGTIAAGAAAVLGQAVAGISSTGTAAPTTPGTDLEGFDVFKTRVLAKFAARPQGGALADYLEWALAVPGVTRAWVVPNGMGAGTVVVYFMMDTAEAAHEGFPQGTGGVATDETRDAPAVGDPLTVANAIFQLQPVTALVYALILGRNTVNFTISLAGASDALKASMAGAIDAAFLAYGAPDATVAKSDIDSGISAIAGTRGFVITAESCDHGAITPTDGNIFTNAGFLPILGTITWTT